MDKEFPKILVCSHTGIYRGGAEASLLFFLKGTSIPKENFLVTVPFYAKDGLYDELSKIYVPAKVIFKDNDETEFRDYFKSPLKLAKRLFRRLSFAFRFAIEIARYRPDIVYINTMRCGTEAIVSKLFFRKVIYHIRGLDGGWKFRLPLIRFATDRIITVAESEKEEFTRAGYKKPIIVIPNGIDPKTAEGVRASGEKKPGRTIVLNVSNIEHRKGIDIFLKAAREALIKNRNLEFWHVGRVINDPSPYFENLKKEYSDLISSGKVRFFGFRQDPLPFIKDCDIFVLPSRKEGFPRVVLEAMLLKKPVISFDRDGQRDQITQGKTGFLAKDEEEITMRILELASSPSIRKKMGLEAHEKVKNKFNIVNYITKLTSAILEGTKSK